MMKRFSFSSSPLDGVWIAERMVNSDERGSFSRVFCADEFSEVIGKKQIVQINHSVNYETGTTRGLHFQKPPFAETKIVTCMKGKIFDVAVDIRAGSETYLHWYGEILSADNNRSLIIPEGFAHGFQTLVPDCELVYLHTGRYAPDYEGGLHTLDPAIHIDWPLAISCMSERDSLHPRINNDFHGVEL